MYRSILVAYNGTSESRSAIDECIRLAPSSSTDIHLLAVVHPSDPLLMGDYSSMAASSREEMMTAERAKLEQDLDQARHLLQNADLNAAVHLEVGEPAEVISTVAGRIGADLVIVGHPRHKSWLQRWWRGSTDALLMEKVHCTLMIASDRSVAA